jgi:DNA-binding NarL/FixJ family response regulator
MRILIIEDEIIISRYIEHTLTNNFICQVHMALKPSEAVAIAEQFLPHLVLCDINLNSPMDGIQLIEKLQQSFVFQTIYITSYQTKDIIEKAASTEPANYIIKPFKETQLIATVKMLELKLHNNPNIGTKVTHFLEDLTKTEYAILKLIVDNKATSEIAQTLFISPLTVKNHRHNITRKLRLPPDNNALLKWTIDNKGIFEKSG